MGSFIYDAKVKVQIEDRALAHLQLVIFAKLRRGEPFVFTWDDDPGIGHGRTSVWLSPRSRMAFVFHGGREPSVNRAWTEVLADSANSSTGLFLAHEPEQGSPAYGYSNR